MLTDLAGNSREYFDISKATMTFQLLPTHLLVGTLNLDFPLTCSKGIFDD